MKFTANQKRLLDLVAYVVKHTSAVLGSGYILIEVTEDNRLHLHAYDGIACVHVSDDVPVDEPGSALVDGGYVLSAIRSMAKGDVTISGRKRLLFRQGELKRYAKTARVDTFPASPVIGDTLKASLETSELLTAIAAVSFTYTSELRPDLAGFCFDPSGHLVTTDAARLALYPLALEGDTTQSLLVAPALESAIKGAARLAGKVSGVSIRCTPPGWIEFALGGSPGIEVILQIASLGSSFPSQIIPIVQGLAVKADGTMITLAKAELERLLAHTLYIYQRTKGEVILNLAIEANGMRLRMKAPQGEVNDLLPAEVVGPDVSAQVHPLYLSQAVKACPGDNITLTMWSAYDPLYMIDGAGWVSILTPMGDATVAHQHAESRRERAGEAVETDDGGDF